MTSVVAKQEDRMGQYFQSDDGCANQATGPLIETQSRALLGLARLRIKPAIVGIVRSKVCGHKEIVLSAAFHRHRQSAPITSLRD
jgi:hypothetical protein